MNTNLENIIEELKSYANSKNVAGMKGYGMTWQNRLGIAIPVLRKMAKEIRENHDLAVKLWRTGICEAKILASMVDDFKKVTRDQADEWVKDFDSWDVCDQTCMNLFENLSFVDDLINDWSNRSEEFAKRAAFALIACLAWHKKDYPDEYFIQFFSIIKSVYPPTTYGTLDFLLT